MPDDSVFDWIASKIDPTHGRPLSEQVELRCEKMQHGLDVCSLDPTRNCHHWEQRLLLCRASMLCANETMAYRRCARMNGARGCEPEWLAMRGCMHGALPGSLEITPGRPSEQYISRPPGVPDG